MVALKDRWKVSVAAMIKRCEQLGIIDHEAVQRLWDQLHEARMA